MVPSCWWTSCARPRDGLLSSRRKWWGGRHAEPVGGPPLNMYTHGLSLTICPSFAGRLSPEQLSAYTNAGPQRKREKKRKEMLRIREMERPSRIYPFLLIALVVIPSRPFSLSFLFPFPPLKVVPDAESQSSSPIKTDSFFVFLRKTPQVPYIAYWTITATTINENCTQILYPTDS